MESVLVNTTQKTELVNRKEGRKEISTNTSILLGLLIGTRRSAIGHSFFFFCPSNCPSLCYKQPKSLI